MKKIVLGICLSLLGYAPHVSAVTLEEVGCNMARDAKKCLKVDFCTLSPTLPEAIAKSFKLLEKCNPALLQNGSYYEFGIYQGYALWMAQKMGASLTSSDFHYFGFDSFAGLPDYSIDYMGGPWQPGAYAVSLERVTAYLSANEAEFSHLHLIKGWFGKELFDSYRDLVKTYPPAIVVIDADTYESCNEVLEYLGESLIPGSIILFDDFIVNYKDNEHGERKSILEYSEQHPDFKMTYLFSFDYHGAAFLVTANQNKFIDNETIQCFKQMITVPGMQITNWPLQD